MEGKPDQFVADEISISRQQEMKKAHEAQQQFHDLLREYMQKIQKKKATFTALSHCLLSFLTAPLLTISTSLQISVAKNIVTMNDFKLMNQQSLKGRAGSLKGEPTKLNLMSFKSKQQLIKSNAFTGVQRPFQAPVYRNYFECFQGLYRQGVLGLYKGNGIRCMHIFLFHRFNSEFTIALEKHGGSFTQQLRQIPFGQELLLSTSIDFLLHPLHLAEGRFIMQNRFSNFRVYQNLRDFFIKSSGEMFRGMFLHLPRNFCIALSGLQMTNQMNLYTYYGQSLLFQTLAYPLLTVQRRLECRSNQVGLIKNDEYKGFFNALLKITREEGVLALYRGYFAYILAITFWMSVLPYATDFLMMRLPLIGQGRQTQQQTQINPYGDDDEDDEED